MEVSLSTPSGPRILPNTSLTHTAKPTTHIVVYEADHAPELPHVVKHSDANNDSKSDFYYTDGSNRQ